MLDRVNVFGVFEPLLSCKHVNLRHENGSLVGRNLVNTGKHLGNSIVGAHISAKSNNGNDLGGAVLAIKDLCLPEKFLALLLLEELGSIATVSPVRKSARRLVLQGDTLDLAYCCSDLIGGIRTSVFNRGVESYKQSNT
jgi:hypothetical protein